MSRLLNFISVDRKIWLFLIEDSHLWYNSSHFFWGLPPGLFFRASSHPCASCIFFSYFTVWKHSADQFTETVIHSKGQMVLQCKIHTPKCTKRMNFYKFCSTCQKEKCMDWIIAWNNLNLFWLLASMNTMGSQKTNKQMDHWTNQSRIHTQGTNDWSQIIPLQTHVVKA